MLLYLVGKHKQTVEVVLKFKVKTESLLSLLESQTGMEVLVEYCS